MPNQTATIEIQNNPETGSVRPFEVWFTSGSNTPMRIASCATREGAEKSVRATIKRNLPYYDITVVGA